MNYNKNITLKKKAFTLVFFFSTLWTYVATQKIKE